MILSMMLSNKILKFKNIFYLITKSCDNIFNLNCKFLKRLKFKIFGIMKINFKSNSENLYNLIKFIESFEFFSIYNFPDKSLNLMNVQKFAQKVRA